MTAKVSWLRRADDSVQSGIDRFIHAFARLCDAPLGYVTAALIGIFILLYASAAFLQRGGPRPGQWFAVGCYFVWFALTSYGASIAGKSAAADSKMYFYAKLWFVVTGVVMLALDILLFVVGPPSSGILAVPLGRFMAMQFLSAAANAGLIVIGYSFMTRPFKKDDGA